jgi:hypothetical protein
MIAVIEPAGWTTFDTMIVGIVNVVVVAGFVVWRLRSQERRVLDAVSELNTVLARVQDEWRFQHRQATYVGSLRGYWRVLKQGADQGGLPLEMRQFIYAAGDEMFDAFDREMRGHHDANPQLEPVLWAKERDS